MRERKTKGEFPKRDLPLVAKKEKKKKRSEDDDGKE